MCKCYWPTSGGVLETVGGSPLGLRPWALLCVWSVPLTLLMPLWACLWPPVTSLCQSQGPNHSLPDFTECLSSLLVFCVELINECATFAPLQAHRISRRFSIGRDLGVILVRKTVGPAEAPVGFHVTQILARAWASSKETCASSLL